MRLEYKVGIVVALAVVGLGTWFFVTRDRASDAPVAAGPTNTAQSPSAARQTSPQPATPLRPGPVQPRPIVRPEAPRTPVSATTRPSQASPTFSIDPNRSATPGIRSETPLGRAEAPSGFAERPTPAVPPQPVAPTAVTEATLSRPLTAAPAGTTVAPQPVPGPGVTPAAPADAAVRTHVMKQGDTIEGLAIKYYGAAKHASLILGANKQLGDPRRIAVGTKITIPPAPPSAPEASKVAGVATTRPAAAARASTAEPRRQPPNTKPYLVKKGDTWRKLAAMYYGSESDAPQLFELNKRSANETMHTLRVGETIYVPLAASQASPPARTLMGTTPKP